MEIIVIAATNVKNVIGFKNTIPWRLPLDFKRFKKETMGHPLVMDRNTFESLPRILPGRKHVVISNTIKSADPSVEIVSSFEKTVDYAKSLNTGKVFIAGGAEVFRKGLDIADKIMLTKVLSSRHEGDVFFPEFNENDWETIFYEHHKKEPKHSDDFSFFDFVRK